MPESKPEPRLVVEHREHLWWLLSEAAQLEHMIMCQYLYAGFSLKDADELTAEQHTMVEGWRKEVHGIAVQEMLHMVLVANLMSAIGAAPTFGRPNFPQRSGYFPAGVQLDLLPFGTAALTHFLYLERPEGMERLDATEFVPEAPPRAPVAPDDALPRPQEFATVGHLYRGIADGLRHLADRLGEDGLFVGPPRAQATPEAFHWPQLIAVTDLESALAAVEEIIEQGEGARGDWRDAHYGRFLRIWDEYKVAREKDPGFAPARPVLPAFTRQPFDTKDPRPLITDPATLEIAELFNVGYEVLLQTLTRYFTHTDETDEQLDLLIGASFDLMTGVLRPLGRTLTRLPAGPDHPGRTVGPAFEMYYQMGNFVPWRTAAWRLLTERFRVLADRCVRVEHANVAATASAVADRLATHIA
ncbi:MAG TPA: ferritin-like protein [Streptosporangiaceae bacterium]|jgi:hypothetical protein